MLLIICVVIYRTGALLSSTVIFFSGCIAKASYTGVGDSSFRISEWLGKSGLSVFQFSFKSAKRYQED